MARTDAVLDEGEQGARVVALSAPSPHERALLERHRGGDPAAFAELIETWQAPIHGYLARSGVAAPERDDLFQEVFLRVHGALRGAEGTDGLPRGPLGPWIFAIAVNAVRSHFRKQKVRAVVSLRDDAGDATADHAPSPEGALVMRETTAWVEAQIARLPLEQREALLLCTVHGLELRDAAEALGVPVDTVKTRVRRARLALAEARARRALREEREEGAR
ncbi:RNA polymerase sigma-70 factor, ECF subfamily [Sandaracinus amylolyticus]|uniref:RNA polymerase sigma-70 factor, ECF subfamily n=1 Tax=Sandaracinus amylolyticus TaxID=927083 RepID=A0A0F6SEK2_9BACT|nr:RNA polymerase sigma-70 factor, ECF subfamily [Sandaracinus amylolyticus]